ncbi:hypothetical protein TNIN_193021 [Trichonephila inaurata madagascariensis]|uniref:Uncharacterized protein n=1 Tax=Trichonephila inaurata madagascariensis TaxID=2747483 RepID=A0A8X6IFG9_9ARAC|nr:hypothetical protein TNIN_193021 [Trichonephila inaurata madagascariensis]
MQSNYSKPKYLTRIPLRVVIANWLKPNLSTVEMSGPSILSDKLQSSELIFFPLYFAPLGRQPLTPDSPPTGAQNCLQNIKPLKRRGETVIIQFEATQ